MPRERMPRPGDLLTARDVANELGISINAAENIHRRLMKKRGGPVKVGTRRVYIERRDLEAAVIGRAGEQAS